MNAIDGVWIVSLTDVNFLRQSWCITFKKFAPYSYQKFSSEFKFLYFAYHMTDLLNFNSYFNHISTSVNSGGESINRRKF